MNQQLLDALIQELPAAIAWGKEVFSTHNPGQPDPTDAEVQAAFLAAFQSSIAKDDAWLAAHPEI